MRKHGIREVSTYLSAEKSKHAGKKFMKVMNELLEWASILGRTYKQLLPKIPRQLVYSTE